MPKQERAERTRSAILDAAAAEFDEHGYEGARLERIVERTGATKGAVYFHFRSKLDLARALVAGGDGDWPAIVSDVTGSGVRGIAAAVEITKRVGVAYAADVRMRAAMKLSQTTLRPAVDGNSCDSWTDLVTMFVTQAVEDGELAGADPREVSAVAIQALFGAYAIADERGRLDALPDDIERLWRVLATVRGDD
ncbi:TetR family transcriptional regulator [Leifsonia xyli subsp. cynodontis DSM 46306]|uniref:HTH tetR-type domain-containing protein n=1 Tax=Leifsonia xyli subsp. cynodontis DSM 46306 TaxID=1389489 RepID=U3P9H9_LEIXC|nr:TetR/AcrR family transcriptional regulator [Leifsonia xyli]AGW42481.1 TetR family transcriptional regulator [Leifsonia xyli subsp. cynodontis DSM 46306]